MNASARHMLRCQPLAINYCLSAFTNTNWKRMNVWLDVLLSVNPLDLSCNIRLEIESDAVLLAFDVCDYFFLSRVVLFLSASLCCSPLNRYHRHLIALPINSHSPKDRCQFLSSQCHSLNPARLNHQLFRLSHHTHTTVKTFIQLKLCHKSVRTATNDRKANTPINQDQPNAELRHCCEIKINFSVSVN